MTVKRLLLLTGLALISAALVLLGNDAPDSSIGRHPGLIAATRVVPDDPPPQAVCCKLDQPPGAPGCIPGVYWDIFSQVCRRVPNAPFVPSHPYLPGGV
jgi:hypothetical protein